MESKEIIDEREHDLIIIGSGPVGLAAAIEAKGYGLKALILEKGVTVNSVFKFPVFMRFFTSADLLEIGNHPFPSTDNKPTRQQTLDYYRGVIKNEKLALHLHSEVQAIEGEKGNFKVKGLKKHRGEEIPFEYEAKYVIVATGYFDTPKGLGGVPGEKGENGENVSCYYSGDPHEFYDQEVVIIGGGNSGCETALELYRYGAKVTLIHKYEDVNDAVKYWVKPDIKNRIKEKKIDALMPAEVKKITMKGVEVECNNELHFIPADYVLILTGYLPDIQLLKKWEITLDSDSFQVLLTEHFESQREGVFVIGSAGAGKATNKVFIENGKEHAKIAASKIAKELIVSKSITSK